MVRAAARAVAEAAFAARSFLSAASSTTEALATSASVAVWTPRLRRVEETGGLRMGLRALDAATRCAADEPKMRAPGPTRFFLIFCLVAGTDGGGDVGGDGDGDGDRDGEGDGGGEGRGGIESAPSNGGYGSSSPVSSLERPFITCGWLACRRKQKVVEGGTSVWKSACDAVPASERWASSRIFSISCLALRYWTVSATVAAEVEAAAVVVVVVVADIVAGSDMEMLKRRRFERGSGGLWYIAVLVWI